MMVALTVAHLRGLLERIGALPARPVFHVFNLGGAAAGVGSFFHRPLDPHYALVAACTPAATVFVVASIFAIRAVRRGY